MARLDDFEARTGLASVAVAKGWILLKVVLRIGSRLGPDPDFSRALQVRRGESSRAEEAVRART
jgi:hypothetical protein